MVPAKKHSGDDGIEAVGGGNSKFAVARGGLKQAGIQQKIVAKSKAAMPTMDAHHNPYESFPNTVVINPSKSSSEIPGGAGAPLTGSYIEHPVENSQYELDIAMNLHDGSFGGHSYDRSLQ